MTFRPSDVVLMPIPLTGTFGCSELECAAALAVWTLRRNGNTWRRLWHDEMEACLRVDVLSGAEPVSSWCRNPFFRPSLAGLQERHFALVTDRTVELTALALSAMERWVHRRGA